MSFQHSHIPSVTEKVKILIAIPCRDMVHSHFTYALQALVKYNTIKGIDTDVRFSIGTLIGNQREFLANEAIKENATHVLWLDSDMMFPSSICETLLGHNLPIVACNYSTRSLPLKSVAYKNLNDWNSYLPKDTTGIETVEGIGMGCMLTKVSVFDDIFKPWFPITYDNITDSYLGEDINFCKRAADAGYQVFVDCDASKEIFHVGSSAFVWAPENKN